MISPAGAITRAGQMACNRISGLQSLPCIRARLAMKSMAGPAYASPMRAPINPEKAVRPISRTEKLYGAASNNKGISAVMPTCSIYATPNHQDARMTTGYLSMTNGRVAMKMKLCCFSAERFGI